MSEKFREKVAIPEQVAANLRKFIEKKKPVQYIRDKRSKKDEDGIKERYPKLRDNAAIGFLGLAKGTAWLAAGGSQFLLTLARWLTMDNKYMRQIENKIQEMKVKKNKDGKTKFVPSFIKSNPNSFSHAIWLLGLTALSFSIYAGVEYVPDAVKQYKEYRTKRAAEKKARGTYKAFLNKVQPITPFLIADLIAKEGVHIDPKTGLHKPYLDSKNIPTIGFGSTMLKDGSRVTMKTKPITTEEAYELARWHLEESETYFILYCYEVSQTNVNITSTSEVLGMGSILYNSYSKLIENPEDKNNKERFEQLRNLYDKYGYGVPDTLVQKIFDRYPIQDTTSFGKFWLKGADKDVVANKLGGFLSGGRGLYWRRWLEAGLLTGDITPGMLLSCPVNGMYEFFCVMGKKKEAFFIGDITNRKVNKETFIKFKQWILNPVNVNGESLKHWKKVADFLPAEVLNFCLNGKCELNNDNFDQVFKSQERVMAKTYTLGYDEQYKQAMASYLKKDYIDAAAQFEKMLIQYPNNALLHNDLAATYNHLGRYEEAIAQAREILHRIGDKSQYAAAQYNAGFAYESLGDFKNALANYKLSVANGNITVNKDVDRINNIYSDNTAAFFNAAKNIKKQDKDNMIKEKLLSKSDKNLD